MTAAQPIIRLLTPSDSIEDLTAMIHRAFARLGAMGLNYTAVDQPPEVTARRIARGEGYVAELDGKIVGTVILCPPKTGSSCEWYRRPDVAIANQLAVEPAFQNRGIGSALMDHVEDTAAQRGFAHIAVDTAEPAEHLRRFYSRREYVQVQYSQWPGKVYRSVILSKCLIG